MIAVDTNILVYAHLGRTRPGMIGAYERLLELAQGRQAWGNVVALRPRISGDRRISTYSIILRLHGHTCWIK